MTKLLGTKDFAQLVIQTKLKMKFAFSSTAQNIQLLQIIFFLIYKAILPTLSKYPART